MNKLIVLSLLVLPFIGKGQNKLDVVEMQLLSEIKKSSSFSFSINPVNVSGRGGIVDFSVGASVYGFNIKDKINFYSEYNLNLGHYDKNDNVYSYQSLDYENKKSNFFELTLGYTLKETKNNTEKEITLFKKANTRIYTVVKAKEFITSAARVGFINQGQFLSGEFENSGAGSTDYMIFNAMNNITLGYQSVSSSKSKYKTDKYGEINEVYQDTYFADLLIALPSEFTYIENRLQSTDSYPVLTPNLTVNEQNEFRSNFRKMPFGLRAGLRSISTSRKNENFRISYAVEVGTNTGYFQSTNPFGMLGLLYAKVSFGVGFLQMLK